MCLTLRAVAGALRAWATAERPCPSPTSPRRWPRRACAARAQLRHDAVAVPLGFREGIGQRLRASASDLAAAIAVGFERLRASLDEPVEGTILTVAREAATRPAARVANRTCASS